METTNTRINIYLVDPEMRTQIKIAAAERGVTVSAFCNDAIRKELAHEIARSQRDSLTSPSVDDADQTLDELLRSVGPIGMPVGELIEDRR